MALTPAPTVRESLEKAVDMVLPEQPVETQATPDTQAVAAEQVVPEKPVEAPKDDGRARNPDGTFAKAEEKAKETPKAEVTPPVVPAPAKPKIAKPQSWKKELEAQWETLPPEVQSNIVEREKQFQTGVSSYKADADRAKGVMDAVNQFAPMLQAMNIEPSHWIKNLGVAHHFLANGTPQEKVQTIADIIRNNRVDANALMQLLSGQQPQFQQPQTQGATPLPQAQQQPIDIEATVEQAFQKREVESAYKAFTADVEAGKYPHFADDEVKGTMAGLLQSGLTQDYPSAYEAALALPKHRHLVAAAQPAAAQAAVAQPDKQAQAARARSQAVSVKSSTPSTMTPASGPKGLRDTIADAFDKATVSRV